MLTFTWDLIVTPWTSYPVDSGKGKMSTLRLQSTLLLLTDSEGPSFTFLFLNLTPGTGKLRYSCFPNQIVCPILSSLVLDLLFSRPYSSKTPSLLLLLLFSRDS